MNLKFPDFCISHEWHNALPWGKKIYGKGASLYTDQVCDAMVLFLVEQFDLNPDCLIGDIGSLYTRKKEIYMKLFGKMTYREYLQAKMRKQFGLLKKIALF